MTSFNGVRARYSLQNLRNYLEDLLSSDLGVFASTNTPAIWVEPPFMTERSTVTGVAVIISRHEKNLDQQHVRSAPQAFQTFDWEVVIRAYDKSATGLVPYDSAITKCDRHFLILEKSCLTLPKMCFLRSGIC